MTNEDHLFLSYSVSTSSTVFGDIRTGCIRNAHRSRLSLVFWSSCSNPYRCGAKHRNSYINTVLGDSE